MPEQKYKRLTRERAPMALNVVISKRYGLWLGEDHLLLVESAFFTETYKRFFFRDIQAITIRKTGGRMIWNIILGVLIGFSTLLLLTIAGQLDAKLVWAGIVFVIFVIPLLLNNFFGPMCACQIRTAVQTENLYSLRRVRQAQKILNRIRPLIAAAQGQMTPEEVNIRMREIALTEPATGTPVAIGAAPPVIS